MVDNFKIVVITPPEPIENEALKIERLLGAGADVISLRKPGIGPRYIESVLEQIRPVLRKRIKLHDYPEIAQHFHTGFQLNSRNSEVSGIPSSMLSKGCHSLNEVIVLDMEVDYVTLSPIYDSISKAGYESQFDPDSLDLGQITTDVVAM